MAEVMKIWLGLVSWLVAQVAIGQSIVGTWKRTETIITYPDGRTDRVQDRITKEMPCTANITYEFTRDGLLKTNIPDECRKMMGPAASVNTEMRYVISGNKITVQSPDPARMPTLTQTYDVKGTTMTMTFSYADQPNVPNPGKAKSVTQLYQKP